MSIHLAVFSGVPIQKKYVFMFTKRHVQGGSLETLFVIAQTWKPALCPSVVEWVN